MDQDQLTVTVSNVGGIDDAERSFTPGVTVLAGRNATNRTSFMQAIMAVFGSEQASLKADADEGSVTLTLDGTEYTRTLTRSADGVTYGGDPYLPDAEVADLFAFLIESNDARRAVARGDDLRDIIMRPLDTAAIHAEIEELEAEKRRIDTELDEIEDKRERLPTLRDRLERRRTEIEAKEAELAEKRDELDDLDRNLEETRQEKTEFEERFSELREAREDLEDLKYRLETERESLESTRAEREELTAAREELDPISESRLDELDETLRTRREDKQAVESEISTLQQVIQFNEEMLEGASADIANALQTDGGTSSSGALTDQLLDETSVVCWTCGSRVERSSVEETLDRLRSLLQDKHSRVREIEADIEALSDEQQSLQSRKQRDEELARRHRQISAEIEDRETTIESLRDRIETQNAEIERLEADVESLEGENYSEVLETHKAANQLEFELERVRGDVDDLEDELARLQSEIEDADDLETTRETVVEDLQALRTKIDRLERESVEAFNEHMAEILEILEYENIERIWLERTERQVKEGRRTVTKSAFDLHIVRSTDDGTIYEDTVEHLSESEREVTGLLFALAGYLVHDVYESLPVMLLDSLEAIDSDRIAALVDYFEQYAGFLFVALLTEDASALDESVARKRIG
jgi:DNA repair exonuclease SbcCD ATPase subunit